MMHITEDTPPDMLAGAMDLTLHLPNDRSVKMSVERSTPMMDLLVQITTRNHLQLSNHTLQVLGMAPSSEHSDKILPYKPNTPIGALDTQHIRVLPKGRTLPAPKYTAPGHQPFESTFRLKVHLPRNQLYVTRVSRNVLLEDIMKKVCEEKNLDPIKYEFKHPGNLDEVLDPKLTLSDYQITEIYVVLKGTTNLSQAFSATDIMTLRKEEERKQMHNKTGGGVFNLIFKRGKSNMGSGSISSDNRSISPTHSDDSRSVTPPAPAFQAPPIVGPPKKEPPPDRPKPPQRKRRPAPKPPQHQNADAAKEAGSEKTSSVVSDDVSPNPPSKKSSENGLTICHSRNSSDSSGYHEASILSDHCANTSLPRTRPKSAFVGDQVPPQGSSTSNLSKMAAHSRSTTSLMAGRKKKAAPPPPPLVVSPANSVVAQSEKPSPLVASQSDTTTKESSEVLETSLTPTINPVPQPKPRNRLKLPPKPRSKSEVFTKTEEFRSSTISNRLSYSEEDIIENPGAEAKEELNKDIVSKVPKEHPSLDFGTLNTSNPIPKKEDIKIEFRLGKEESSSAKSKNLQVSSRTNTSKSNFSLEEILASLEAVNPFIKDKESINIIREAESIINDEIGYSEETTSAFAQSSPKTSVSQIQKSTMSSIFTSEEFSGGSKPPAIVGVIPKTPKEDKRFASNKDSFGKKRCFQIGSSILEHNFDPETASISSKKSVESKSSQNSITSALNALDDEISDLDQNMFTGSLSKASTNKRPEIFNQLFGMHAFEADLERPLPKNVSAGSLRSLASVPGFNGASMKKWGNTEDLDSVSLCSLGVRNTWLAGDASDTESITSSNLTPIQTPYDSLPPCPLEISPPTTLRREEKSLDSTDSGIAQDAHSDREKDGDDEFSVQTPPPPPILDDIEQSKTNLDTSRTEISYILNRTSATNDINRQAELSQDIIPPPSLVTTVSGTDAATTKIPEKLVATPARISEVAPPLPAVERPKTPAVDSNLLTPVSLHPNNKQTDQHIKIVDIDWQYQLPSPPKAFRDSSPALLAATCETNSVSDFKDSVVTSPELFEKLRSLEESQSEKDTLKSEGTSIASEEPLNTLSLEHLERRKSLVYNRELATSLKMTDNLEKTGPTETFAGSLTTFQTTFDSLSREKEVKHFKEPARTNHSAHTIPNFKITTYDVPKQNITVFEDDTIRSNTVSSNPTKNQFDRSMENISFSKRPIMEENNQEAKDYKFYRPVSTNVGSIATVSRSGSFSKENRFPLKPVSRSKSHLTLNKYQDGSFKLTSEDALSRSNSLFDVSGLQSLEVMKLIQNKLSTPTGSMENVSFKETQQNQGPQNRSLNIDITKKEPPKPSEIKPVEKKPETQAKIYYYKGPPAVNMSTWSERPKIPVSVKEDADYKLGNTNVSSKLIVNTTNNNITSNNSIEVRNSEPKRNGNSQIFEQNNKNVGIRVNGSSEQITQESGNVVIKIGGSQNSYSKNIESQRFLGPTAYRKPFASINRNYHMNPRPHSIAFDSDFDISRVPVVRSVEFKKPYKDSHPKNTSVTHIYQGSDNINILHQNGHHTDLSSEKYKSTENLRSTEKQESEPTRRVFRVGSLKPADNAGPVVRGFKTSSNDIGHRLSWNPSINYGTLPTKSKTEREYSTNQHVPFSQSTLRRTESSKIINVDHNQNIATPPPLKAVNNFESNSYNSLPPTLTSSKLEIASVPPPPPPQMPKVALRHVPQKQMKIRSVETDPRDMLLESIRNFGGKKGLRAGKA